MFGMPRSPTHIPAPVGRIKTRDELVDLIIEARKEKKAVRIWTVAQSGYLSPFFITSKSRLEKPDESAGYSRDDNFYEVKGYKLSTFGNRTRAEDRYYRDRILTGSYNIGCNGGSHHYAFTNRVLAERYSETLKTDPIYTQYVKDWHAYCDRTFRWA